MSEFDSCGKCHGKNLFAGNLTSHLGLLATVTFNLLYFKDFGAYKIIVNIFCSICSNIYSVLVALTIT